MITPEEFPYIKSLYVNDCYAYKNFNIELHDYKPFSHLILTGKNGSGKSTILRTLDDHVQYLFSGRSVNEEYSELNRAIKEGRADHWPFLYKQGQMELLSKLQRVNPVFLSQFNKDLLPLNQSAIIYTLFEARRLGLVDTVDTPTKETDFINQLRNHESDSFFVKKFVQYLVNKKVNQAFDQIDNKLDNLSKSNDFFQELTDRLKLIFDDSLLELIFIKENFEIYIKLNDGRRITFNDLPDGYSAFVSILMDLFVRVDLIRKMINDYTYDPCGIVLIDEPETHLHLQLQEQVLPLLTSLFPNVQFIAATHSPAVIASIKQATIFDLTTKESRASEDTVGRSYSDLMISHFGLDNEYSETADQIIKQVNTVLNTLADQPVEKKAALQRIYDENSAYLSPTLKVELEMLIIQHDAQQEVNQ